MAESRFTSEERAQIFRSFFDADPQQLQKAQTVAAMLAEDDEDVAEAALAITYFYSQKENKKALEELLNKLSISDI